MSTGTIAPAPWLTALDDNGSVISGALMYTYAAGTSTLLDTFTDVDMLVRNSNPVVADSAGRMVMFLSATSYKFVLKRPNGSLVREQDNISSVGAAGGGSTGEQFFFGGDAVSPVTDTAYPTGATYDKTHAGTSVYNVDSAVLVGTYVLEAMLLGAGGGTVTAALVNLDDGTPDTPLVSVASSSTTGARVQSGAVTFAAPGAAKNYGIKVKVSSGSGNVWGVRLLRTA